MKNLEENTGFNIQNNKLILGCVLIVEMPLLQILFINFEDDDKGPIITIKLISGPEIKNRVRRY